MLKILFSHFGLYRKGGWGRTYSLAKGLSELGCFVTIITTSANISLFPQKVIVGTNLIIIIFPDIIPKKITSKGYGFLSIIYKLIFTSIRKFDIVHSDSGHRPASGWPCLINRFFYKSIYISEWWDNFGINGQLPNKSKIFKLILGKYETFSEINNKKIANGIVVLSESMRRRAKNLGIISERIELIQGGADIEKIKPKPIKSAKFIHFGYIGMEESEINDLKPFLEVISNFKGKIKFHTYGNKISQNIINKYNLNDIIIEEGWIDYQKDSHKLSNVDIFILIKRDNEINCAGWPNKLGDYLACGRPILVTPYGDIIRFSKDNDKCFIKTEYNKFEIESALNDIIQGKYNFKEMGLFAQYLANKISWFNKSKQLLEFYSKIKRIKNEAN